MKMTFELAYYCPGDCTQNVYTLTIGDISIALDEEERRELRLLLRPKHADYKGWRV